MKNFVAEKIEKKLEKMGIYENYDRPVNASFISARAGKIKCKNGAYNWYMLSKERNVIYASSTTATKCAGGKFTVSVKVLSEEQAARFFKEKHISPDILIYPLTVIELIGE